MYLLGSAVFKSFHQELSQLTYSKRQRHLSPTVGVFDAKEQPIAIHQLFEVGRPFHRARSVDKVRIISKAC